MTEKTDESEIVTFEEFGLRYKLAKAPHQNKSLVEINGEWKLSTMPAENVRAELERRAKRKVIENKTTLEIVQKIMAGPMNTERRVIVHLSKANAPLAPREISDACHLSYGGVAATVKSLHALGVLEQDGLRKVGDRKTPSRIYSLSVTVEKAA